jgi:hypothetical protein
VLSPIFQVQGEEHLNLVFDNALRLLERRAIRERVLSHDDLELLRQPVLARMHMLLLEPDQLYGFLVFAAQGGIPLRVLQQDPLLPLDENLVASLMPGRWLPPHLTERVINPASDLAIQQQRILGVMQRCMRQLNIDMPIFFLGSGAAQCSGLASDIDIGTSREVRSMYMGQYDTVATLMRNTLTADPLILGRKGHVGAVFDHMVLGLGVSVAWYGRAFRVTPDEVYAIERRLV